MTTLNPEQRDELIDAYCDHFVKNADRRTLELVVWDTIHEDLHSLSASDLVGLLEEDYPELLET